MNKFNSGESSPSKQTIASNDIYKKISELHRKFPLEIGAKNFLGPIWEKPFQLILEFESFGSTLQKLNDKLLAVTFSIKMNAVPGKVHTHFIVFAHGVRAYAQIEGRIGSRNTVTVISIHCYHSFMSNKRLTDERKRVSVQRTKWFIMVFLVDHNYLLECIHNPKWRRYQATVFRQDRER